MISGMLLMVAVMLPDGEFEVRHQRIHAAGPLSAELVCSIRLKAFLSPPPLTGQPVPLANAYNAAARQRVGICIPVVFGGVDV